MSSSKAEIFDKLPPIWNGNIVEPDVAVLIGIRAECVEEVAKGGHIELSENVRSICL